jgi:chitinase
MVAPYVYKDNHWFGYDDETSVAAKASYVVERGLGGAFVWSVDTDDLRGNRVERLERSPPL